MRTGEKGEADLRKLADQARAAHEREQEVFVVRLTTSAWKLPELGELEPWSRAIQTIEAAGWRLAHWSTAAEASGLNAYPLFRRRGAQPSDPTSYEGGGGLPPAP